MKCHYEGTGYLEGKCIGTKGIDPCVGYERCATFKSYTMTNAERIRAMSDEELAKVIAGLICVGHCVMSCSCSECFLGKICGEDIGAVEVLDFLKQPAKDGDNNG